MALSPLTIVTCIFNPRRFQSRIRLYRQFAAYCKRYGCRLVTVEVSLGERDEEIKGESGEEVIHLRTTAEIWHKERALNIGIKYALESDKSCQYIAWIDADVQFSEPNWPEETVHALQHYQCVQMFGQAAMLNPANEIMWQCDSTFKFFVNKGFHQKPPIETKYIANGHPGLAWACRRDMWENCEGLLDTTISGSGDTLMAWALRGRYQEFTGNTWGLPKNCSLSAGYMAAIQKWARRCDVHVKENVGYVPGTALHYWHGKSQSRGYDKRWQIISFHKFDPDCDLIVDPNSGLYMLRPGHKPQLEQDLRLSAAQRNEDTIEV